MGGEGRRSTAKEDKGQEDEDEDEAQGEEEGEEEEEEEEESEDTATHEFEDDDIAEPAQLHLYTGKNYGGEGPGDAWTRRRGTARTKTRRRRCS